MSQHPLYNLQWHVVLDQLRSPGFPDGIWSAMRWKKATGYSAFVELTADVSWIHLKPMTRERFQQRITQNSIYLIGKGFRHLNFTYFMTFLSPCFSKTHHLTVKVNITKRKAVEISIIEQSM